ncbi:leucine-rich repeat-containing protein 43-like isoform X2 [Pungitius pungitius]|uniref:leucine-rich repeat-containing protein 43-like isoform X2 n=1 Tax=Pungitius pungitius TaxID=134920 RepID=UPI002E0E2941
MSSNKLSAVLEKQIQRLCLKDFPVGHGTWRRTEGRTEGAETEDTDALLDLLSCPHSPWRHDGSWSPQALALRQLAVLTPEPLHQDLIYNYFTTLRIVDKSVSAIDDGLLKFSKLEELVLSDNHISQICAENLPSSLKILDVRANRLSALDSLTTCPPPCLQYLSLSSNRLGSHQDLHHLTGRHWPQLVGLDLGLCEFEDQQALLRALSTLPSLRTLVLEGNPFTLAPSYPGFTVDSLPGLSCLDTSWISPEERHHFRGFAKNNVAVGWASCTVSVGRMRGIPHPVMRVDENLSDFPVVSYSYFITYEFLSHQAGDPNSDRDSKPDAAQCFSDADLQPHRHSGTESSKLNTGDLLVDPEETCHHIAYVSEHSTSKLMWSGCMDFSHTQTYIVTDLGGLKRFLNGGLCLTIVEEKVQSWPAASEDVLLAKPSRPVKEKSGKGKEDLGKKIKEDKKDKESKQRGDSGTKQKKTTASKGKGKGRRGGDVHTDNSDSVPVEPVTVEVNVGLEKWGRASEAHQPLSPQQNSLNTQPV